MLETAIPRAIRSLVVVCAAVAGSGCQAPGPTNADPGGSGTHDRDPLVASVSVTPSTATLTVLPAGQTLQLQAVPLDAQKRPLSGRAVAWASDDPQRVRVDASGRVTAVRGTGLVRVTATIQGVQGAALVSAVVYRNDFTGQAPGPLTRAALDATWNTPAAGHGVAERRVEIVSGTEAFQGGESMRIAFPKGAVGPDAGGALWVLPLGGSYRELYASYRVRFGPGFRFAQGGKLPGLAGGTGNTGGIRPTGLDGWSGRVMWAPAGRMLQYVYHPDQAGDFGEGMPWIAADRRVVLVPNRWYHVETRVVMNSPGQRDGTVQTWVDGAPVLERGGLRFRDTPAWGIDAFHVTTFFGGSDPSWAAQRDEVVYFDDFVIATERTWSGAAPPAPEPEPTPGW
jgi:hypothetical protein